MSGAGKFAAESLTVTKKKSFAAEPKTVRDTESKRKNFDGLKDVTLGEVVKDGRQIHAVYFYICGRQRQQK